MGKIKALIGLAKASPYKLVLILTLVTSLIGFVVWYDNARWKAGYNAAKAEELKAVKKAEKVLVAKYDKILSRNLRERKAALRLIERLRNQPEVTHSEIKEAANASSCKHLGPEFNRVFNKLVGPEPAD